MSQLFRGQEIQIDARCVASGNAIRVRMRDSDVLEVTPDTAVAHANVLMENWGQPNWAFT